MYRRFLWARRFTLLKNSVNYHLAETDLDNVFANLRESGKV